MGEFVLADGYRPRLPLVEVERQVLERYDTVRVDHDGLEEMYHGDLEVPRSFIPRLQLRDQEALGAAGPGMYNPFTHVMMANPRLARQKMGADGLPVVLLHEGQHLADGLNRPFRMLGGFVASKFVLAGGGYAGYKAGIELLTPQALLTYLAAVAGGAMSVNVTAKLMHVFSPAEIRARATGRREELVEKYRDVIQCA